MTGQFHEDLFRRPAVAESSDRAFGLVFTAAFAALGLWPLTRGEPAIPALLAIAGAFLAVALLRPALLAPLNRWWLRLGALLHRITSPIVLALVFFGVLLPIALLMRATGKRPLQLGFERDRPSYWMVREPAGPAPDTMTRQF